LYYFSQVLNEIGDKFYYGREGEKVDYYKAVSFYEKAAELGNSEGILNF